MATCRYGPYGEILAVGGAAPALAARNPLRYRAYYYDVATALHYLPARYYEPGTTRFLAPDPAPPEASDPLTLNVYAYCVGDPVNLEDPSGAVHLMAGGGFVRSTPAAPIVSSTVRSCHRTTVPRCHQDWTLSAVERRQLYRVFGTMAATAGAAAWTSGGLLYGAQLIAAKVGTVGSMTAASRVASSSSSGVAPVRLGQAGEAAVRGTYNIGPKARFMLDGRVRIADGWTASTMSEVKNVSYLSYTQQMRDYVGYASANSMRVDLYVRPSTVLSPQLTQVLADPTVPLSLRLIP